MTIRRMLEIAAEHRPTIIGLAALGAIDAGIWGLAGWQWALIAAGAPFAAFYLYGEAYIARRRPNASSGDPD